ncbi:hypothetical protein C345_00111 [Cryptococcus neoformans A2-102-5]|nr:hypothetical protein C345_00111 [Cryptococcus neoformans var. grubii A2-102-5]
MECISNIIQQCIIFLSTSLVTTLCRSDTRNLHLSLPPNHRSSCMSLELLATDAASPVKVVSMLYVALNKAVKLVER